MASRAALHVLLVFLFSLACLGQRRPDNGFGLQTGSITGTVYRGAGHPVPGAQVEVQNLDTHIFVAYTQTLGNGRFATDSLPAGRYEVVITDGLDQARTQVEITWAPENVTVHLPEAVADDAGGRDRVSVNQLQVPKKARDALRKAQEALRRSDIAGAGRLVEQALALDPQYAQALSLRGMLHLEAGERDPALADLQQAIHCDPGDPVTYLLLGVTYNWLQRFDDAAGALDRALALAPNAWFAYFEMGVALEGKGDFAGALRRLDQAASLAPQDFALIHLAKARAWKGLQNSALEKAEMEAYRIRAAAESGPAAPRPPSAAGNALLPPGTKDEH